MRVLLLSLLLAAPVSAEIYKSVDEDGNVIYKDTSDENAKEFVPPSMNAIPMPKWQKQQESNEDEEKPAGYRSLSIVQPGNDQVVRSNTGQMSVSVAVRPELMPEHTLEIQLDGNTVVRDSRDTSHQLSSVFPGAHSLRAIIRSSSGKILKRSAAINFTMLRKHTNKSSQAGPRYNSGQLVKPGPQITHFKPGPIPPGETNP